MVHIADSNTEIPSDSDLVIILSSNHTSSLLQPLDVPTFGRWLSHLQPPLHSSRTESDNNSDTESGNESTTHSTSSLPDLADVESDNSSVGTASSMPKLAAFDSDDSSVGNTSSLPDLADISSDDS